ncbi:MAG: LytTR family DNA-binding domain-containing protein [Christensenellaceae bacterium]
MKDEAIKIAVCDDLPKDRKHLLSMLGEYLDRNNIYAEMNEFSSGETFLSSDTASYQLVFLDIFMTGINGMETAKKLCFENPHALVVFQSTSRDFAAEAFSISALHYLIKPVDKEKLNTVLDKFFKHYYSVRTVTVKVGRIDENIYFSDILFIEAKNKKTVIHTKHGNLESSTPLFELEECLPNSDFCKPIRWALVSMREIINMPEDKIELSDGTMITISRSNRENIKKRFSDYKWNQMRTRLEGR